ncbi:kinase-like protein [Macrolepiota fuliginosa MF-IS2]|uniref:Kinase-like protein n=1 Tax=Macrolepiota fuliginosa MF-IS2 TaxID=1400762 RepID=A0A9P5XBN3_9AGAR|nr:kinase-like protein [Macrolepiota fuliginosa MF-IS2]
MALYQLCEYTRFYPHYYVLRNVDVKSREDGGSLSDVYKGRLGGHILCLKVMRLNKSDTIAALGAYTKEAVLWGEMRHPNIVPFYGIFYLDEAHTQLCLVSPWMKNGDVVGYLKDNPDASRESLVGIRFPPTIPKSFTNPKIYDVALGLEYLQAQKLVHSDLKGANILVDDDGRACITDFGMTFLRLDAMMPLAIGLSQHLGYPSYRWLAPELAVDDTRPTLKSDIWAFGCVCFEVLSGLLPFHGCRADPQIIMRLHRGELPSGSDPQVIAGIDDDMYKLMSRCWSKDPAGRPSCREILKILRMKGVTGKNVDADRTRRFQLATADETVDLTKIGEILGEVPLKNHSAVITTIIVI